MAVKIVSGIVNKAAVSDLSRAPVHVIEIEAGVQNGNLYTFTSPSNLSDPTSLHGPAMFLVILVAF